MKKEIYVYMYVRKYDTCSVYEAESEGVDGRWTIANTPRTRVCKWRERERVGRKDNLCRGFMRV